MSKKIYKQTDQTSLSANELVAQYYRTPAIEKVPVSKDWNPNVPFVGTQEEWWEHFHGIEEETFIPVSEIHQNIFQWMSSQKK